MKSLRSFLKQRIEIAIDRFWALMSSLLNSLFFESFYSPSELIPELINIAIHPDNSIGWGTDRNSCVVSRAVDK